MIQDVQKLGHISYSAVTTYLADRQDFFRRYVMGIREYRDTPSTLVGHAVHKYIETVLIGHGEECAHATGEHMIRNAIEVDWGKTGTVEECLRKFNYARSLFDTEGQRAIFGMVHLGAEQEYRRKVPGIRVTIKAIIDAIFMDEEGRIWIYDWKTTTKLEEGIKPAFIIQAMMYRWAVWKTYGKIPYAMAFFTMKVNPSRDDAAVTRTDSIIYDEHAIEEKAVKRLVQSVLREASRKHPAFLPNVRSDFTARSSWESYIQSFTETPQI